MEWNTHFCSDGTIVRFPGRVVPVAVLTAMTNNCLFWRLVPEYANNTNWYVTNSTYELAGTSLYVQESTYTKNLPAVQSTNHTSGNIATDLFMSLVQRESNTIMCVLLWRRKSFLNCDILSWNESKQGTRIRSGRPFAWANKPSPVTCITQK